MKTGSRDGWLMGLAGLTMVLVVFFIGASMVTDRNREAAVKDLRARQPAKTARIASQHSGAKGQRETRSESAAQTATSPPREDTIAAYKQLFEKRKAIQEDPAWQDVFQILAEKQPKEWTEEDRRRIAAYLEANRDIIQELIRLADVGGPIADLDFSQGAATPLPHLAMLRDCERLLGTDVAMKAEARDYAGAVRNIVAGMKLAHSISEEPLLISQLVAMAMDGIMRDTVESCLHGEDLPPDLARSLIECAGQAGNHEAFANSYTSEAALFGLETFDGIRNGRIGPDSLYQTDNRWNATSIWLQVYGTPICRPWLNLDEEEYADIMARMSEVVQRPYYEAKPDLDQLDQELRDLPFTRVMTRMMLMGMTRAAEAQARHEANMDLMRMGLAVELYHAQNGQYPGSLDAIAPILGGTVPLDPYTGQPYVYQVSGGGFVLRNNRGSVVGPDMRKPSLAWDENGNLVWRGSQA